MGKRNKDIPFKGPAGLNESVSNFQMFKQGAKTALNVLFKSWGSFKSIHKRKGKTRVNTTAANGDIRNLKYYELGGTKYVAAYTDKETLYDVNMSTGALTQFGKNLGSNPTPKQFNDRIYYSNDSEQYTVEDCEATTGWLIIDSAGGGSFGTWTTHTKGTYSLKAENDGSTLNLGMYSDAGTVDVDLGGKYLEFDIYLEDSDGGVANLTNLVVEIGVSNAVANWISMLPAYQNSATGFNLGWNHIIIDPGFENMGTAGGGFDPETTQCTYIEIKSTSDAGTGGKITAIDNIIATPKHTGVCYTKDNTQLNSIMSLTTPTQVKDIEVFDGRLMAVTEDSVYWSNPNTGYDFTTNIPESFDLYCETTATSAVIEVADKTLIQVGMSVDGYGIVASTTVESIDADLNQVTLSNAIPGDGAAEWKGPLTFGSVDSTTYLGWHHSIWPANIELQSGQSGDGISVGDIVTGTGIPADTVVTAIIDATPKIVSLNNTPTAHDTYYSYTFTDPDGSNISIGGLDSSNLTIDSAGDDELVACRRLGNTLFLFKKHSMFRMRITGDTVIPYRIDPMYVGKDDVGVGCINKNSICYAVLGSLQEGLGEQEYLIFQAESDWYAIHEYGKPTRITPRVRTTIDGIPDANKTSMFSVNYPKQGMVLIGYPTSSVDYCSEQLVYGTHSKEWSRFDWLNLTAAEVYIGATNSYLLLGDKDGYIYKHDYQTTTAATDYRDMIAAGTYIATDAQWELHRSDYGNTGTNKDVISTEVTCKKTATDMPITITVSNEKDTSNSTSISTNIGSATDLVQRVTTKMYGKYLSHKFSNAVLSNSMDILFWATEIRATGDNK